MIQMGARNNPQGKCDRTAVGCLEKDRRPRRSRATTNPAVRPGSFQRGSPGIEPKLEARPESGEAVYHKRVNSAFIGTTLEADLHSQAFAPWSLWAFDQPLAFPRRFEWPAIWVRYVCRCRRNGNLRSRRSDGRLRPADESTTQALGDLQEEFATLSIRLGDSCAEPGEPESMVSPPRAIGTESLIRQINEYDHNRIARSIHSLGENQ